MTTCSINCHLSTQKFLVPYTINFGKVIGPFEWEVQEESGPNMRQNGSGVHRRFFEPIVVISISNVDVRHLIFIQMTVEVK